ncbi:MAG: nucleotide sugar dehydrogenase [Erysipelotrichales bacterium]|nr:nucleotide sugar dehydrogenase [Erysipelotrichales bacterium]
MKIAVAGIGYVGLSLAVLLAQHNEVIAVDVVKEKVDKLNNKISPIQDEFIEKYLKEEKLNLTATVDAVSAYEKSDIIIIAAPTNYDPNLNYFDTSIIEKLLDLISSVNQYALVVIKSTVPVGYTEEMSKKHPNMDIVFSPEFLRESKALYDNLYPSRIIVGTTKTELSHLEKVKQFATLLSEAAIKENIPTIFMNSTEAEAVKLFANTYLALRVAYFNELDTYAELKGLDTKSIIEGVSLDPRIGDFYNNPSFGYGGYCLPKDTKQLKANYKSVPENLISAIIESNDTRKKFIAEQLISRLENKENKIIGIYRLTMKMNSDSFRQSAILDIIDILKNGGVKIVIFEPLFNDDYYLNCKIIKSFEEFINMSEIIVANRYDENLDRVKNKIYTRDLYKRD